MSPSSFHPWVFRQKQYGFFSLPAVFTRFSIGSFPSLSPEENIAQGLPLSWSRSNRRGSSIQLWKTRPLGQIPKQQKCWDRCIVAQDYFGEEDVKFKQRSCFLLNIPNLKIRMCGCVWLFAFHRRNCNKKISILLNAARINIQAIFGGISTPI